MSNSMKTRSMSVKAVKRTRSTCRLANEEMPSEPDRKRRKRLQTADVNSSIRRVSTRLSLRRSTAREHRLSLRRSTAVEQTAEINDRRCQLRPEGHAHNEHRSVDEDKQVTEHSLVGNKSDGPHNDSERIAEHSSVGNSGDDPRSIGVQQVAEHSSVVNSSDGASVKCPVCSVPFTTQQVATPDTCDHTFCAACLHELSQNENKCPLDKIMFNFILVRHRLGGKEIMRIPVEPPRQQCKCNREDGEHPCCEYILGHGWTPVLAFAQFLASVGILYYVLPAYFSR
jgi:hypothetical protein